MSIMKTVEKLANNHTVLFAGRLLKSKGLLEFLYVASRLNHLAKFVVAGRLDFENKDCISKDELYRSIHKNHIEYLGYSVEKAIHIKYVISACLAGGAGGLMAASLGRVDPDSMVLWSVSGELVFVTIMSGLGNILAPFIGAVIFEFIRTYAFEWAPQAWQMIIGGTLLAIIFFSPGGLWSLFQKLNFLRKKNNE